MRSRALAALGSAMSICIADTSIAALTDMSRDAEIGRCIRQASANRLWLERTLWGLRDKEGGWIGGEIANANGSHDLGPLQINSQWVVRLATLSKTSPELVRYALINDPCYNVAVARWLFLTALQTTGDYWRAVGAYHSPSPRRAQAYARSVARHLTARYGDRVFADLSPAHRQCRGDACT